ncbi:MAG: hypothetical protein K6F68_06270 [Clostridiales bacterium]|nr:hypothetical protein [Clostridiales bacterium]
MVKAENPKEASPAVKKRAGTRRLKTRMSRLSDTAFDALEVILTDESVKPADRLAAIKLTFDLANKCAVQDAPAENGVLRVVFEGIEKELAE